MNLQYISDNKGKITGVFIPICDWNHLKNKYKEIDQEEKDSLEIAEWHKCIVRRRSTDYQANPENVLDWDLFQNEIEGEYGF